MKQHTIAILGTGSAATTHIEAYQSLNKINVKYVFSHSIKRAKDFSAQYNIPIFTNQISHILQDKAVDIVDIATIPNKHLYYAESALQNSKGVMIEKPIAIQYKDALSFYHRYKSSCQPILIVYQYAYSETFKTLKELCHSMKYGRLLNYRIDYRTQRRPDYYHGWTADPKQVGGGVLINQGIHFINLLAEFIRSPALNIKAETTNLKHCLPVEDTVSIIVQHENTTKGTYFFSTALPSQMHIELLFEKAFVSAKGDGKILIDSSSRKEILTPHKGNFNDLIQDFFCNIVEEPALKKNFSQSICDLQLIEAAYRSAQQGKTMWLDNIIIES